MDQSEQQVLKRMNSQQFRRYFEADVEGKSWIMLREAGFDIDELKNKGFRYDPKSSDGVLLQASQFLDVEVLEVEGYWE